MKTDSITCANEVREAILISAIFAQRTLAFLREGNTARALEDATRTAAVTSQLTKFICSHGEVTI